MSVATSVIYQASLFDGSSIDLISASGSHKRYGATEAIPLSRDNIAHAGESASDYRSRWISLIVVFGIIFMQGILTSMYWVSLWPYLSEIEPDATETFLGIIQMAYSLAGAISAPVFGYWTNRIHQTKIPIVAGICISMAGNLLLAFVEAFPSHRQWIMLIARIITGIGSGNVGALFTYVVSASTVEQLGKTIAIRSACGSGGLMIGPTFQTLFTPIGFPGLSHGMFHLNMYTAAAYANVIIGVIELIIFATLFKEHSINNVGDSRNQDDRHLRRSFDKTAVAVCLLLRFVLSYIIAYDSSLVSPLTMVMFNWSPTGAVFYNGIIQAVITGIQIVGNIIVGTFVLRYVMERVTLVWGIIAFMLFFLISFSWPGLPPLIATTAEQSSLYSNSSSSNSTESGIVTARMVNGTCMHSWCTYTTRIYLAQYLIAVVFYTLSISIAFTPNASLFSKVIGPVEQGTLQGLFSAVGQVARTVSPLAGGILFDKYGPRAAWILCLVILACSLIPVGITYHRLVPYRFGYEILT